MREEGKSTAEEEREAKMETAAAKSKEGGGRMGRREDGDWTRRLCMGGAKWNLAGCAVLQSAGGAVKNGGWQL